MFSDKNTPQKTDSISELQLPSVHPVAQMQEEIADASLHDQRENRASASISRNLGKEVSLLNPEQSKEGHVVSLGSGGDIMRPMYDFPLASHYHMVDLMIGWCDGPTSVIEEIEHRLGSLAPDAKVERIANGFTSLVNAETLQDGKLLQQQLEQVPEYATQPIQWKVSWTSAALGPQERLVSLHPIDYDKTEGHSLASVVDTIPDSEGIRGVLLTGSALPNPEVTSNLIDRMTPGASIVAEVYYNLDDHIPLFATKEHLDAFTEPCEVQQVAPDEAICKVLAQDGRGVDTLVLNKKAL